MLSLCLTNFNRYEMLLESFQHVYDDPRIGEIVISDDCSDVNIYNKVEDYCKDKKKIHLFRNERNLGMSLNKRKAIELASNDWCILFDSDNILKPDYLDALPENLSPDTFYLPSFAKPNFDYRKFEGLTVNAKNIRSYLQAPMMEQCLNTCNMVVYRDGYLAAYEYDPTVKETDTLHMNYLWLRRGGMLLIMPSMEYFHRVGPHSGWLQNADYNIRKGKEQLNLIKGL